MGLQQASKQRRAERRAKGKTKNYMDRQVEKAKSKEPVSLKAQDAIECEGTEKQSRIHQKAQETTHTENRQSRSQRWNQVISDLNLNQLDKHLNKPNSHLYSNGHQSISL